METRTALAKYYLTLKYTIAKLLRAEITSKSDDRCWAEISNAFDFLCFNIPHKGDANTRTIQLNTYEKFTTKIPLFATRLEFAASQQLHPSTATN